MHILCIMGIIVFIAENVAFIPQKYCSQNYNVVLPQGIPHLNRFLVFENFREQTKNLIFLENIIGTTYVIN